MCVLVFFFLGAVIPKSSAIDLSAADFIAGTSECGLAGGW
jgi:hypothetical protein